MPPRTVGTTSVYLQKVFGDSSYSLSQYLSCNTQVFSVHLSRTFNRGPRETAPLFFQLLASFSLEVTPLSGQDGNGRPRQTRLVIEGFGANGLVDKISEGRAAKLSLRSLHHMGSQDCTRDGAAARPANGVTAGIHVLCPRSRRPRHAWRACPLPLPMTTSGGNIHGPTWG